MKREQLFVHQQQSAAWIGVVQRGPSAVSRTGARVPGSRLAASMLLGRTLKMLKSLNSIGRGYLRLLANGLAVELDYTRFNRI